MCWEYYTTAGPGMQEKNENLQFESINSSLRRRRCRREGQEMLLLYVGEEQKSRPPRDAAGGSANVVEGAGVHGAGLLASLETISAVSVAMTSSSLVGMSRCAQWRRQRRYRSPRREPCSFQIDLDAHKA